MKMEIEEDGRVTVTVEKEESIRCTSCQKQIKDTGWVCVSTARTKLFCCNDCHGDNMQYFQARCHRLSGYDEVEFALFDIKVE